MRIVFFRFENLLEHLHKMPSLAIRSVRFVFVKMFYLIQHTFRYCVGNSSFQRENIQFAKEFTEPYAMFSVCTRRILKLNQKLFAKIVEDEWMI